MNILGHPVHPMLVHFPTAFFSGSYLLDIGGIMLAENSFWTASFYLQVMGIAGGFIAAIFGAIDYLELTDRETEFRKASYHGIIQLIVLAVFGTLAGIRFESFPGLDTPSLIYLLSGGAAVLLMIAGNYLGGDLVFRHGIGVKK